MSKGDREGDQWGRERGRWEIVRGSLVHGTNKERNFDLTGLEAGLGLGVLLGKCLF